MNHGTDHAAENKAAPAMAEHSTYTVPGSSVKSSASTPVMRSFFITNLAWISIVVSAVASLLTGLQVLVFFLWVDDLAYQEMLAYLSSQNLLPADLLWLFQRMRPIMLASLLFSLASLLISIALLQRREWARLAFIALIVVGIAGSGAGLYLQFKFYFAAKLATAAGTAAPLYAMGLGAHVLSTALTVLLMLLSAWLIRRLQSAAVRAEFCSG